MKGKQNTTKDTKKSHWEKLMRERKAILAWHRISLSHIAREIGRSVHTVGTIVNRYPEKKSRYIQKRIAEILSVPYEKLWDGPCDSHTASLSNKKRPVND